MNRDNFVDSIQGVASYETQNFAGSMMYNKQDSLLTGDNMTVEE